MWNKGPTLIHPLPLCLRLTLQVPRSLLTCPAAASRSPRVHLPQPARPCLTLHLGGKGKGFPSHRRWRRPEGLPHYSNASPGKLGKPEPYPGLLTSAPGHPTSWAEWPSLHAHVQSQKPLGPQSCTPSSFLPFPLPAMLFLGLEP